MDERTSDTAGGLCCPGNLLKLSDDLGRPPSARVVTAVNDPIAQFVTHQQLKQFREELITSFDKQVAKLDSMLKSLEKKVLPNHEAR